MRFVMIRVFISGLCALSLVSTTLAMNLQKDLDQKVDLSSSVIDLLAPKKGDYGLLEPNEVHRSIQAHRLLLEAGLCSKDSVTWYAIADEYRQLYDNHEALSFAQNICTLLAEQEGLPHDIRALSALRLSKMMHKNGLSEEAFRWAARAEELGRTVSSYGQILCFLGDLCCYSGDQIQQGWEWYLKARKWATDSNNKRILAQALIGLGNAHYPIDHPIEPSCLSHLKDLTLLGDGCRNHDDLLRCYRYAEDLKARGHGDTGWDDYRRYRNDLEMDLKKHDEVLVWYWYAEALKTLGHGDSGGDIYRKYQHEKDEALRQMADEMLRGSQLCIRLGEKDEALRRIADGILRGSRNEIDGQLHIRQEQLRARYSEDDRHVYYMLDKNENSDLQAEALIGWGIARNPLGYNCCWYFEKALSILGTTGNRELRARALIGLAVMPSTSASKRMSWYVEAFNVLGIHGDRNLRAQLCIALGKTGYTDNLHSSKIAWYLEAYTLLAAYGNKNLRAEARILLGNEGHADATHITKVDWYREAAGLLGKDGDAELQAEAFVGLGDSRYTDATHQDAAQWYLDALSVKTGDSDNEKILKARACLGLGRAHYTDSHVKLVGNACWYLRALHYLESIPNVALLLAEAFIGVGDTGYTDYKASYYFDPIHRTVDYWYLRALDFNSRNGDSTLQARALFGLGNYYCSQKNNSRGLDCLQKALAGAPEDMKMSIHEKIKAVQDLMRASHEETSKATRSFDREVLTYEE